MGREARAKTARWAAGESVARGNPEATPLQMRAINPEKRKAALADGQLTRAQFSDRAYIMDAKGTLRRKRSGVIAQAVHQIHAIRLSVVSLNRGVGVSNDKDPKAFLDEHSHVPTLGAPITMNGGFPTISITCQCPGKVSLLLVGFGAPAVCKACGKGYKLLAYTHDPRIGPPKLDIDIMLPASVLAGN